MELDCQTCGACCTSPFGETSEPFVAVTAGDVERLGPARARRLVVVDPRAATGLGLAVQAGAPARCAALDGPPGARVSCAVYADRPAACRAVEPGGRYCLESRGRLGLAGPS